MGGNQRSPPEWHIPHAEGPTLKKLLLLLALAGLTAGALLILRHQQIDVETVRAHVNALSEWRASNAALVVGGFFVTYVLVTALSLPVATWMTLAAGALFGFWQGVLIVSFASTLGATLAFLAARYLLRDWVHDRLGDRARSLDAGLAKDGAFYLFTLRLIPVVPFFAVNLLMGLTPIKTLTFYLVSQAGMLAGTAVYVNAGTQLAQIEEVSGIVSLPLLLSFALLGVFPWIARIILRLVKGRTEDEDIKVEERA